MVNLGSLNEDREVAKICQSFNPQENGGEQLLLTTVLRNNGDGPSGFYTRQKLTLCSYGNSADINLDANCQITPDIFNSFEMSKRTDSMELDTIIY